MPYCTSCGTQNPEGATHCVKCQMPIASRAAAAPPPSYYASPPPVYEQPTQPPVSTPPPAAGVPPVYAPPAAPPPVAGVTPAYTPPTMNSAAAPQLIADSPPPSSSRYHVLSTGAIWGSIFLMNIPIIGWVICLCWAFSKKGNLNRRNLARATLIFIIINLLLLWGAYSILNHFVKIFIDALQPATSGATGSVLNDWCGVSKMLEDFLTFLKSLAF